MPGIRAGAILDLVPLDHMIISKLLERLSDRLRADSQVSMCVSSLSVVAICVEGIIKLMSFAYLLRSFS